LDAMTGAAPLRQALLIGGEPAVRAALHAYLAGAGFDIHEVSGGAAALARSRRDRFELIVLDDVLNDLDGFTVCRVLRAAGRNTTTPLVLLLSQASASEIALGLDSGADHCIDRQADIRQLLARLTALVRRAIPAEPPIQSRRPVRRPHVTIDPERRQVTVRGAAVELTMQQFELLYVLASRPGVAFSRAALLARVWPDDHAVTGRTIDTAMSRLRAKIERSDTPELLLTVRGIGYAFAAD
jgi:two-component system response regulator MprA